MIGTTVSHYRIVEKLGEVRNFPTPACEPKDTSAGRSVFGPEGPKGIPLEDASPRVVENFRIPLERSGSGRSSI
jgi:hypothetical protein